MRYIAVVRGRLRAEDEQQSKSVHNATVDMVGPMGRSMGNVSHKAYLNAQDRRQFLAIDTWDNLENMQQLFNDPRLAEEFGKLFEGMPEVTIYAETDWTSW